MKYLELHQKLMDAGIDADRTIYFALYNPGLPEMELVPYNIVLRGGTYRIFGANERQSYYPLVFSLEGADVEFSTEDEACDFIWERISRPKPVPGKLPKRTQAEWDAMRERTVERAMRARAAYFKEHGLDESGQGSSDQK